MTHSRFKVSVAAATREDRSKLAVEYGERMILIAMAGLPATGKSTIARALAARFGAPVLDKDAIRAAIFAPEFVTYDSEQDDWCMRVAYQAAEFLMGTGRQPCVILDGRTFRRTEQVNELRLLADRLTARLCLVECRCSEATAAARMAEQARAGGHPAANRTIDLFRALRSAMDEIEVEKLVLDTDRLALHECIERAALLVERARAQR